MRQEKVISVSGGQVVTDQGIRRTMGDVRLAPGAYVWVDGEFIFGHDEAGGVAPYVAELPGYLLFETTYDDLDNEYLKAVVVNQADPTKINAIRGKSFNLESDDKGIYLFAISPNGKTFILGYNNEGTEKTIFYDVTQNAKVILNENIDLLGFWATETDETICMCRLWDELSDNPWAPKVYKNGVLFFDYKPMFDATASSLISSADSYISELINTFTPSAVKSIEGNNYYRSSKTYNQHRVKAPRFKITSGTPALPVDEEEEPQIGVFTIYTWSGTSDTVTSYEISPGLSIEEVVAEICALSMPGWDATVDPLDSTSMIFTQTTNYSTYLRAAFIIDGTQVEGIYAEEWWRVKNFGFGFSNQLPYDESSFWDFMGSECYSYNPLDGTLVLKRRDGTTTSRVISFEIDKSSPDEQTVHTEDIRALTSIDGVHCTEAVLNVSNLMVYKLFVNGIHATNFPLVGTQSINDAAIFTIRRYKHHSYLSNGDAISRSSINSETIDEIVLGAYFDVSSGFGEPAVSTFNITAPSYVQETIGEHNDFYDTSGDLLITSYTSDKVYSYDDKYVFATSGIYRRSDGVVLDIPLSYPKVHPTFCKKNRKAFNSIASALKPENFE